VLCFSITIFLTVICLRTSKLSKEQKVHALLTVASFSSLLSVALCQILGTIIAGTNHRITVVFSLERGILMVAL